ncbi:hypothetical protein ACHAXR_001396, partial [Thalassiosira sp. AJA248-18]
PITSSPSKSPSAKPTDSPTAKPVTSSPSKSPSAKPTDSPTANPTNVPTANPTSQLTNAPSTNPTQLPTKSLSFFSPTPCPHPEVEIEIRTDNYPLETSWELFNNCTEKIVETSPVYANTTTLYSENYCLPPGMYTFIMKDAWGDGICCSFKEGYYKVMYGETVEMEGGDFGLVESKTFGSCGASSTKELTTLPTNGPTTGPTSQPTDSPTTTPTKVPTKEPTSKVNGHFTWI